MIIHLQLYAQLKDAAKRDHLEMELKDDATVGDLREEIKRQMPELSKFMKSVTFAVNDEYAGADQILMPGINVAVIPPISGG